MIDANTTELVDQARLRASRKCADGYAVPFDVDLDNALADTIERLVSLIDFNSDWLASFDEDRLEEIITDSIDLDWTPRTAARAIVRAMKGGDT
jgi:hypothetical protein